MVLFFGCRSPSEHLYKEEVEEALKLGALTHSFTAYSRLPEIAKVSCYIQIRYILSSFCLPGVKEKLEIQKKKFCFVVARNYCDV